MDSREYVNIQIALQSFFVAETLEQLQVSKKLSFETLPFSINDDKGKEIFTIPTSQLDSYEYENALHNMKLLIFGSLIMTVHKSLMESPLIDKSDKNIEDLCQVFSCIRNAPAHGPTRPRWYLTKNSYKKPFCFDLQFSNGKIIQIKIDLTNAHDTDVEFSQFGGFVNVFSMIAFVLEKCK